MTRSADSSGYASRARLFYEGQWDTLRSPETVEAIRQLMVSIRAETIQECIAQVPNAESSDTDDIQNALRALLFTSDGEKP